MPEISDLDAVVRSYPWFMTARVVRAGAIKAKEGMPDFSAAPDVQLDMHHIAMPSSIRTASEVVASTPSEPVYDTSAQDAIIDKFLGHGEYRITPQEGGETLQDAQVPDAAAPASGENAITEIVTEELADIYMRQHLLPQARAVYEKLSLLYPKKSVYFAEIIARIDSMEAAGHNTGNN